MEGMIRLTLFFLVLSLAAVSDIRKRMIPDWMPFLIAGVSLFPPEPVYLTGLLVALPLLIAGITVGGIGGGDIKLTGVKLHFIPNLNLKLFLKSFLCFLTFILRFHHIIPKNCVYKRTDNFSKKLNIAGMPSLSKIVRLFFDEFYSCHL